MLSVLVLLSLANDILQRHVLNDALDLQLFGISRSFRQKLQVSWLGVCTSRIGLCSTPIPAKAQCTDGRS